MNGKNRFFFERHRKAILITLALVFSFLSITMCELLLREFMGLGNPILYDSSPIYGLKEMDSFLRENGYKHFVFITPSKSQVVEGAGKDMAVYNLLTRYELPFRYIADEIAKYNLSNKEKQGLFHDGSHLEKKGHQLWAKIIAAELKKGLSLYSISAGNDMPRILMQYHYFHSDNVVRGRVFAEL